MAPALAVTSAPYINGTNVSNVTVTGTGDNGDSISVVITDHLSHVTTTATTTVSAGSWSVSGIDAAGLDDGAVTYSVTETDAVDNTTTHAPTATKVSEVAFTNTPNVNLANYGSVTVSGTGDNGGSSDDGDSISVTITDGSVTTTAATTTVSGGTWSVAGIDASSLADGTVTYAVTETDASSNSTTATQTETKITVAPAATFTGTPNIYMPNVHSVTVTGTGDNGDTISVVIADTASHSTTTATTTVSGGSWSISGIDASGLTDGTVTYAASETDAAGNTITITQNETKFTVAPLAAFTSTPSVNIANVNSLAVSGTGDNGDSISVVITDTASHSITTTTTTVSGGTWSVSGIDASTLADGTVTYSVTETDAVGNTTTISQSVAKITVAPTEAFTSTPNVIIANAGSVTVTGTGNGDTISVTITDGSTTTLAATATVSGGSWSVSGINASGLSDGTVTYSATETDAVGNTTTITQNETKDTVTPTVAFTSTPIINIANVQSITASGTGDNGDAISVVITDGVGHTTTAATTTVSGGTWSVSGINASSVTDGTVTYSVTETDAYGNATTVPQRVVKDTVAPAETFTSTPNVNVANAGSVTVTGTGDNGDAISVTITDGTHTTTVATTTVSGGTWSVSGINASGLSDGTVTYAATETDAVANFTSITQNKTKITVAPMVAFTTTPNITNANVSSVAASGTGGNGDTISVTITDGTQHDHGGDDDGQRRHLVGQRHKRLRAHRWRGHLRGHGNRCGRQYRQRQPG